MTDRREVLDSIVASQDDLHRRFGGVVTEIASRAHVERILPVVDEALRKANVSLADIDAVAPDGPIEAVSLNEPKSFLLGVQWHPEWKFASDPLSTSIFRAFGEAVAESAAKRA